MSDTESTSAALARVSAERDALQARLDAAYNRLGIDEFGGSYAHDLESLIDFAVDQYLLVCDSEAKAADMIRDARWACVGCGYHNGGPVCTHCGKALIGASDA